MARMSETDYPPFLTLPKTGLRLELERPKGSGWEPIFPRGRNKVEGEAEEGVVVSSVSACGRRGGCGQSRGRMGWG